MFSMTPVSAPAAIVGVGLLALLAPRLLARREPEDEADGMENDTQSFKSEPVGHASTCSPVRDKYHVSPLRCICGLGLSDFTLQRVQSFTTPGRYSAWHCNPEYM